MGTSIQAKKVNNVSTTQATNACKPGDEKKTNSVFQTKGPKNEDEIKEQHQSRNKIYQTISELCVEYRIDIEDAKKANLLESIAGCSTEALVAMEPEELNAVISALKFALKLDFKVFWKDRNIDDINSIAQKANEKYIREKTGGNWFKQKIKKITTKSRLCDELVSQGYLDKEKVGDKAAVRDALKQRFKEKYLGDLKNLSKEKIEKKYKKALEQFGYLLNIFKNAEDKELLTAVISELKAENRELATDVAISSSGGDKVARSKIAKGVSDNYEEVVTQKDALGNAPTQEAATGISHRAFENMTEKDAEEAVATLNDKSKKFFDENREKLDAIQEKLARGEKLTSEEEELLLKANNAYTAKYSGAITGTCVNTEIEKSGKNDLLRNISKGTSEAGITKEVIDNVEKFVETKKLVLPQNAKKEISQFVEKEKDSIAYQQQLKKEEENKNLAKQNIAKQNIAKQNSEEIKKTDPGQTNKNEKEETIVVPEKKNNNITNEKSTIILNENAKQNRNTETTKESNSVNKTNTQATKKSTKQEINDSQKETKNASNNIREAIKGGHKTIDEFFKNNSSTTVVKEVFNNIEHITSLSTIEKATQLYTNLNDRRQEHILRNVGNAGLTELLHHTSDNTLFRLKDETFSNFYATQQVKEAAENAEEKTV